MATFSYTPDFGAALTRRPATKSIRFADGYEQRVRYGINTNPQAWSLKFANRDDTETQAIEDFLTAAAGADWFYWTPPKQSTALKFICRTWSVEIVRANLNTISATFEQVFDI